MSVVVDAVLEAYIRDLIRVMSASMRGRREEGRRCVVQKSRQKERGLQWGRAR